MRGQPQRSEKGGDPGGRPESDRPGDRVRLLLRPCRLRPPGDGLRDDHGQLQSGDGVHRLRHGGPTVLRAADHGRRLEYRGPGATGGRDRPVRRTDAAQAGRPPAAGGRAGAGDPAGRHRSGRGPGAVQAVAAKAGVESAAQRHGDLVRRGGADRQADRLPGAGAPLLRPGWTRHGDRLRRDRPQGLHGAGGASVARSPHPGGQVPGGRHRDGCGRRLRRDDRRGRWDHGTHRGGGNPLGRLRLLAAALVCERAAAGCRSGSRPGRWRWSWAWSG